MPTIAAMELEEGMVAPTAAGPSRLRKAGMVASAVLATGCLGAVAGYALAKHAAGPRTHAMAESKLTLSRVMDSALAKLDAAGDSAGREAVLAGKAFEDRLTEDRVSTLVHRVKIDKFPIAEGYQLRMAWRLAAEAQAMGNEETKSAAEECAAAYEYEAAWSMAAHNLVQQAELALAKQRTTRNATLTEREQEFRDASSAVVAGMDARDKARASKALEVARGSLCAAWPVEGLPPSVYELEMVRYIREGAAEHVLPAMQNVSRAVFGHRELSLDNFGEIISLFGSMNPVPVAMVAALADLAADGDDAAVEAVLAGAKGLVERLSASQIFPMTFDSWVAHLNGDAGELLQRMRRMRQPDAMALVASREGVARMCSLGYEMEGLWKLAITLKQVAGVPNDMKAKVDADAAAMTAELGDDEKERVTKAANAVRHALCDELEASPQ